MGSGAHKLLFLSAAVFLFSTSGFADTLELTGVQGGVMGGVYTSPYLGTIDGNPALLICDDFNTDSHLGLPTVTAYATSVADLTSASLVKFDAGSDPTKRQTDYAVAAYLAEEIVQENSKQSPDVTRLGYLSFALWDVFDPTLIPAGGGVSVSDGYGTLSADETTGAWNALQDAETNTNAQSYLNYGNVLIYTPQPFTSSQEFLYVDGPAMPEPSGVPMLGAALVGLLGAAVRRKKIAAACSK